MDGMKLLKTEGPEQVIMEALKSATDSVLFKLQERQAQLIASAVSKMFKK